MYNEFGENSNFETNIYRFLGDPTPVHSMRHLHRVHESEILYYF